MLILLRAKSNVKCLGKVLVVVLAVIALAIAYQPPASIFAIAKQTFTGYAVLFPTAFVVLNFKKVSPTACIISILAGETWLIGAHFGAIPGSWFMGFEPVVPVVGLAALIILVGQFIINSKEERTTVTR